MKPKIIKKFSLNESPYLIFSNKRSSLISRIPRLNLQEISKTGNIYDKNTQISKITTYEKQIYDITSVTKSLKAVTLNSDLFSNYINYHSNLTQEYCFKTPRVNKYPLLKNKNYLSVKFQSLTDRDSNKNREIFSRDISNSIFLSYIKETKAKKKFIEKKSYGFKYGETKIILDKDKMTDSLSAGKDFGELCENNLFKSEFLKTIRLKKIDMNNCFEEKQKNFKFFCDYIKKANESKDIFNQKDFHKNIKFNGRTTIKNENIEFNLNIYSLCFKFFSLSENNKEKKSQKLYFPFKLMPLFYLLDFASFKVLLSEIIIFNENNNSFEYIKNNLLIQTVKKYFDFILNSLESKKDYINNITYNKKETIFSLIYDWIVTSNAINEEEEENNNNIKSEFNNNNYKCFKLKIVLPKIKFYVDNLDIKINKLLSKYIIANILQNNFKKWEKFIFFDLFSTKRFRIIINLIMMNKHYKISLKKINIDKNYQVHKMFY